MRLIYISLILVATTGCLHNHYVTAGAGYMPTGLETHKLEDEVTVEVQSQVVPIYYIGYTTINNRRGLLFESKVMSNGGGTLGLGLRFD